jgi:hypothetical protein
MGIYQQLFEDKHQQTRFRIAYKATATRMSAADDPTGKGEE